MIELELTFLAKALPADLQDHPSKEIIDLYVENGTDHADLRIRKNGTTYELTRKTPVEEGDASKQTEITIPLTEVEFESFKKTAAKTVAKTRYFYPHGGQTAEFDVFTGPLDGLVVVDFEFATEGDKDDFTMPDFCLADITQETFIAGGVIAGKTYAEIENEVNRFDYKPLKL